MPNPNSYIDSRENVENHLHDLSAALQSDNCQIDVLYVKKGQNPKDPYSTAYTLQDLDYDSSDLKRVLANLTIGDYIESIRDNKILNSPDFRVFGIVLSGKEIYIKEKLRGTKYVFCISFHYAEFPLKEHPYT